MEKIWILLKTQVFNICGIRPKTGIFRNAVKIFLAVYARKLTDSLNPKKFNCGGGHICPKVKTPYGQKRGGAPAANRAERERRQKGAQSAAAPPTAAALSPRAAEIVRKANMCAYLARRKNSRNAAQPPTSLSAPRRAQKGAPRRARLF